MVVDHACIMPLSQIPLLLPCQVVRTWYLYHDSMFGKGTKSLLVPDVD
ncbi:unnamed protein product [Amoebophrya sp. A25]|nr:unnamed protein product [Amoebophrya sp. A25]|eukprot:GSA25T00018919001.1